MLLEVVVCLLKNIIVDLNLSTTGTRSCFQDHVGSFRARTELRQTRRVPPSCKRTCVFAKDELCWSYRHWLQWLTAEEKWAGEEQKIPLHLQHYIIRWKTMPDFLIAYLLGAKFNHKLHLILKLEGWWRILSITHQKKATFLTLFALLPAILP